MIGLDLEGKVSLTEDALLEIDERVKMLENESAVKARKWRCFAISVAITVATSVTAFLIVSVVYSFSQWSLNG